jgi:hypothetical protein
MVLYKPSAWYFISERLSTTQDALRGVPETPRDSVAVFLTQQEETLVSCTMGLYLPTSHETRLVANESCNTLLLICRPVTKLKQTILPLWTVLGASVAQLL